MRGWDEKGDMTAQEQQIALCEWMGWSWIKHPMTALGYWENGTQGEPGYKRTEWLQPAEQAVGLPNTSSLDVLHEMEKRLTWPQRTLYAHILTRILLLENRIEYPQDEPTDLVEEFTVLNATAAQRREALLRTLNLWKE